MDTSLVNGISDHDSSDHDSSDDDVPLSKLLKKPQNDDKQLHGSTGSLTLSSNNHSGKDKSGLNDTSDDEPLERLTKEPDNHENKSGSTSGMSNKKTDLSGHGSSDDDEDVPLIKFMQKQKDERRQHEKTKGPTVTSKAALAKHDVSDVKKDDSSDDEPLIKKSKVSSKAAKQTRLLSTKRLADTDRKESLEDDVSSDDEPLSELAKKLKLQHQTRPPVTPPRNASLVKRCKRKVPRKKVQSLESSSDSSDDEPLIKLKKMTTKNLSEEKVTTNGRKTKPNTKDQLPKDPSSSGGSSDDDVPLVNLIGKQDKPAGKDTEKTKTPVLRTSKAARKRRELSDESSDDEPSINREKKTLRDTTTPSTKAKTSKKKTAAPANKQPGKALVARKNTGSDTPSEGSSSNSSDDEALIKTVKNPQVRKILRVILERCSVEELGAAGCLNKTSTVDEEMMEADSDLPEESPEETVPEEA